MRTIIVVKYAFTLVGAAMLIGALLWYTSTRTFLAKAAQAQGTVIELEPVRSSDGTTYRPLVRFNDERGQSIQISSSVSSNPPSFAKGESVRVYYDRDDPRVAKLDGYFQLWGGPTIIAALGSVFLLVGGGIIVAGWFIRSRDDALRSGGEPIETDFQSVELNTALDVNGRHPFRVATQWLNPATSEVHVFHSHNLWFDPTAYIGNRRITVYIKPGNPKSYYVDLSFLPKLAT